MSRLNIHELPAAGRVTRGEKKKFERMWSTHPRPLSSIDTLIIHSMFNENGRTPAQQFSPEACRDILINTGPGLSAHYILDKQGEVYQLVKPNRVAGHAGVSKMPEPDGRTGINKFSIGVELLANKQNGFSMAQYQSLALLTGELMDQIPIANILGHSHIAGPEVRPDDPKTDPWLFLWNLYLRSLTTEIGNRGVSQIQMAPWTR